MSMKRILRAPAAAALTAILYSSFASAQLSTSTITGSVVDPQGLGVAAAKVVATNEATSVSHESVTTSAGDYSVSGLPPGTYTITISQTGFRTFTSLHNVLNVGAPIVVNATLAVGATQEIVKVEGSYERLDTTSAMMSDVVQRRAIQNLPLNGRNPLNLITLQTGVVQRSNGAAGSGTHVNGSRDRAFNLTLDGNKPIVDSSCTFPSPDVIACSAFPGSRAPARGTDLHDNPPASPR